MARFLVADNGGWPHCEIELTNGWNFIYRNSMVNGYYAPDDLFSLASKRRPILIKDFAGKWNMTEAEAIELVKRTVAKLSYPTNLVHMDFAPRIRTSVYKRQIPRYWLEWWYTAEHLQSKVEAEVDADKRELKSLYFDDKAFWNKPPPIDVPIRLPALAKTNGTAANRAVKPKGLPKPPQRPVKLPQERNVP